MSKKLNVVTTEKAMEMFSCSRRTFYTKYKPQLTQLPSTTNRCYYSEKEVLELLKKTNKPELKYNVIE